MLVGTNLSYTCEIGGNIMKLIEGKNFETYIIKEINLEEGIKRRLEMLGMTQNSKIEILNSKKSGTMVVRIRGTRYAIGKEFVAGIEVGGEVDE